MKLAIRPAYAPDAPEILIDTEDSAEIGRAVRSALKKSWLILLVVAGLTACTFSEWGKAQNLCASHDGVRDLRVSPQREVTCNDGEVLK